MDVVRWFAGRAGMDVPVALKKRRAVHRVILMVVARQNGANPAEHRVEGVQRAAAISHG
jgi:hypothetical protein